MINKVSHITLYTDNQEETMKFYVDKVGLKVHTDASYEGMRWLTLSPENQGDFELVIMKAEKPEAKALIGKQSPEAPLLVFSTDDCQGDFERLKANGVKFIKEPTKEFWGTEALFLDPHGNMIDMVQV